MEGPPHSLLESVAEDIAAGILEDYALVSGVRILIKKPHVAVEGVVDYLGAPAHFPMVPKGTRWAGAGRGCSEQPMLHATVLCSARWNVQCLCRRGDREEPLAAVGGRVAHACPLGVHSE